MAARRRRPKNTSIHSDQGSQYGSDAWKRFCKSDYLEAFHNRTRRHSHLGGVSPDEFEVAAAAVSTITARSNGAVRAAA